MIKPLARRGRGPQHRLKGSRARYRFSPCTPLVALALIAAPAAAQELPSGPLSFADGRLTIGADVAASISTDSDQGGWFNYTDYKYNALRLARLGMTAALRMSDQISVLGELRSENGDTLRPYALFIRVRPWKGRTIDLQAGRIPPTFGAFARRAYAPDNPLIGYPLAYQYLTSMRPDAVPADSGDLLAMRGRGWLASYRLGEQRPDRGMPLVSAFRWDTGVQVRIGSAPWSISAAVTNGTLSNPRSKDDNGGKQVSARLEWRPVVGLVVGGSGARGPYLSDTLAPFLGGATGTFTQRAVGFDVEYARNHWQVRSEGVWSSWRLPTVAAPLRALGVFVEARYTVVPGLFVAGRIDRLSFSDLTTAGAARSWDAPVKRIETGAGYYLRRNLLAKAVFQRNWRDGGQVRRLRMAAVQLQFWL